jgi:lipopolysaccharide export system protein LptA
MKLLTALLLFLASMMVPAFAENSHDNSLPIEITADSLAVDQKDGSATFTGNVDAKQGDVRIRSHKMIVSYSSTSKAAKPAAPAIPASASNAPGAINKVTLLGNITITSNGDIAQGQHGIYDVKKQMIFLDTDVVLSQGKNIVKGDKLVYNVTTGKSDISAGQASAVDSAGKKSSGRVKGVFIPQKNN